jgi:hypothetical protein
VFRCAVCRFLVELDDVVVRNRCGLCICLRCYLRLVEKEKPMPAWLRGALVEVLAAIRDVWVW